MKLPLVTLPAIALVLAPLSRNADAQTAADLHTACEKGDVDRVRLLLNDTDPNAANSKGETPLMLAARTGSFELCRALLWAGAKANAGDKTGKKARDWLKTDAAGFTAVNLLLRCYSFVQANAAPPPPKPARPELVIISDSFIDHDHRDLKASYWVNKAEATGKKNTDDDKNGFVDDVYGWNATADEPLRAPLLANLADEVQADILRRFVTLYNRTENPEYGGTAWKGQSLQDLRDVYENPLVRQLGFDTLKKGGVKIDDLTFTNMLVAASHGTHVAGIVLRHSGGKALLHGMTHGRFQLPKEAGAELTGLAHRLAPRTISYEQFLLKLRQTLLDDALAHGKRRGAYVRATGAGVVNMSWSQSKSWFVRLASEIQRIYADDGMDPESLARYVCPPGLDLCGDLGLELLVAAAAELAVMIHDNPDVLFVVAAGNETEDNDEEMPSPAYLSRFFPNVITVASVDEDDVFSSFSNYGPASVQVAAPGENIVSAFLSNQEGIMDGTSMAAPAVSGLAARIRAGHPHLTAADVRLIIERSALPEESLETRVSSGGVMDADGAMALAALWAPGSRADLTLAALTAPRKAAKEKEIELPEEPEEHLPAAISATAADKGPRISAIGGFSGQWRVIMSEGTAFQQQTVHPVGKLPLPWIKSKSDQGWEITGLGGEFDNWRVVMSHTGKPGRQQKLLGLDFDTSSINDLLDTGWRITAHAGFSRSWVFALTANTGWQEQIYSLPGPFDAARRQWVTKNLADGYRITSVAGDEYDKDHSQDSWSLVMTRGTAQGEQVLTGPGPWPEDWIRDHAAKGYLTSHCSGFGDHWLVVMTKTAKPAKQTTSTGGAWDDAWVREQWSGR